MKMRRSWIMVAFTFAVGVACAASPQPLPPVPSAQQLGWQRMEMTMFLHFGVNTFTDREWGDGKESPAIFNPSALDCRQWARTARAAGFKLLILTAKHHDGFCLWPSAYTEHSVKNSPWRDGKGDVVREFVAACRAEELKVGLYLSPWDRNQPVYGDSPRYNKYFCNQLTELMTRYGVIDEIWFDGACGEGPNGKKQVYDWEQYYTTVYGHNPHALIAICGPDVRWVGNESGVARRGESSVQTANGSRHKGVSGKVWYPAECDVSIRPGWFYHQSQDGRVKSLDHLLDIYFKSVGRNSVLLVNVPPDRRGLLAPPDEQRLRELQAAIRDMLGHDRAEGAVVTATHVRDGGEHGPLAARDRDLDTCWSVPDAVKTASLELRLPEPRTFNVVNVQEAINLGERVRRYRVELEQDGQWRTIAAGTIIGHRNLLRLARHTASAVRLVIDDAAACPAIAEFSLHLCEHDKGWASGSLTAHKPAKASNVHGGGTVYGGDKAVDDDMATRWATSDETRACWVEVDLLRPETIGRLGISELEPRITRFNLEGRKAPQAPWQVIHAGGKAGKKHVASFKPAEVRYVRLHILEATFAPTIWEFQLFPPK